MRTRNLIVAIAALIVFGGLIHRAASQSSFPIQFDSPGPENLATAQSSGGLVVSTETHYSKSVALTVSPSSAEDILTVTATQDDTTVMIRILAASRTSSSADPGSIREYIAWAIYDSGTNTWNNVIAHPSIAAPGGGTLALAFTPSTNTLTASITTPGTHDLVSLSMEAIANKSVTFTEHF